MRPAIRSVPIRRLLAARILALTLSLVALTGVPAEADATVEPGVRAEADATVEPGVPGEAEAPAAVDAWDRVYWTATTGFDFSRGDYGLDRDTTLYYVPVGLIADYDRFRFRVVVPFLVSDGPSSIRLRGTTSTDSEREAGLGDITAAGSVLFTPFAAGLPYLEIGAQITAPTRTSSALGTGEWVFAARVDLFERFGPVTPFASFGRSFYTSRQEDSLDDRFFSSLGASLELGDSVSMGLSYDWFQAASGAAPDAHEIVPFLSFEVTEAWTLGPYAVFGLSDGSPDYGVGVGLSFAP